VTLTRTITPTYSITLTPLPTVTAQAPAVLSVNVFHPVFGRPLLIGFRPPQAGHVTVRIYNLAGERMEKAFDSDVAAGAWIQATWSGANGGGEPVASGLYFVSIQGAGLRSVLKVILVKGPA
jgi:hypothetical protein